MHGTKISFFMGSKRISSTVSIGVVLTQVLDKADTMDENVRLKSGGDHSSGQASHSTRKIDSITVSIKLAHTMRVKNNIILGKVHFPAVREV